MAKQLLFEDRARVKLQRGIKTLADAVGMTMGPTGRNVIIDKNRSAIPVVTKDGVTVSPRKIELDDPVRTHGRQARQRSRDRRPATSPATARPPRPFSPAPSYDEGLRSITLGSNPDGRPPRDR